MRHKIVKGIIFYMLIGCVQTAKSQTKPAAVPYKLFFEKVYLHTDREQYLQGDDIWFKTYLVNAQNNIPIGTSGNLSVELISPDGGIIAQKTVRLENGIGNGDFKLTDTIAAGQYHIRAYTNWMRNFGNNFIFEKKISIVSIVDNEVVKINEVKTTALKDNPKKVPANKPNSLVAKFYPEGGSLIEGVNLPIAVKIEDELGKGIPAKVSITNTTGDTVLKFRADTLGMAVFSLPPAKNEGYRAFIEFGNKKAEAALPPALIKGISLSIRNADSLNNVLISCNNDWLADNVNHTFTIKGKHGGKVYFEQVIKLSMTQTLIKIPESLLPEGVASFTLYDEQNKPHSERLVYIRNKAKTLSASVKTDKLIFAGKGKTTIAIKLNDTTARANLSLAAYDAGLITAQPDDIVSYLMLRSEVRGEIEQAGRYFDTTNVNRFKQLDLLLMTQGWRDFVWCRIADTAIRIRYNAENGYTIKGRIRQKFADNPIPGINVTLSAFGAKGARVVTTKTDSAGKYYFDGLQLYGRQPIKLSARDNKGQRAGMLQLDSVFNVQLPINIKPLPLIDTNESIKMAALTKTWHERERTTKVKSLKDTIHLREVKIAQKRKTEIFDDGLVGTEFGYPDQTYIITKKDLFFESLENWLAHNVSGAIISPRNDVGVFFYGYIGQQHVLLPPFFLVNGKQILYNADIRNAYYNLSMEKIKKVVLRHLVGMWKLTSMDIFLLYLTIDGDPFENKDFGFERATIRGYDEARVFYKPTYDNKTDMNKQDNRTTIHWEPNITTDAKGEATVSYYNADPKTKIRIVVQGISDKGVPLFVTTLYTVE